MRGSSRWPDGKLQLGFLDAPPPVDPRPVNTAPWKAYAGVTLYLGSCEAVMRAMPADSVDAGVTDPPYGIGFMGKEWDTFDPEKARATKHFAINNGDHGRKDSPNPNLRGRRQTPAISPSQIEYDRWIEGQRGFQRFTEGWARELLRVLKPGAHLVVCGAPRSAHRMVCGLEDAGFEIRDSFAWLFGQGFPKSKNLRDEDGSKSGWGTALKPGHEPICLARKPLRSDVENTAAVWGVGALNIEACRINPGAVVPGGSGGFSADGSMHGVDGHYEGRWPANVLLDEHAASLLDEHAGERVSGANPTRRGSDKFRKIFGTFKGEASCTPARGAERGGASRFYFVAKPSRAERDFGCEDLPARTPGECTEREEGSAGITPYAGAGRSGGGRNFHPTVKPVALMRWLMRLVTPPAGTVLDPFLGSGTTGMAAAVDGYTFLGIEKEEKYMALSDARISAVLREVSS